MDGWMDGWREGGREGGRKGGRECRVGGVIVLSWAFIAIARMPTATRHRIAQRRVRTWVYVCRKTQGVYSEDAARYRYDTVCVLKQYT
jgi:hypothetical protein